MMTQKNKRKNSARFMCIFMAFLLFTLTTYAQLRLGGTIFDKQVGKTLEGANIILEKSGRNAVSGGDGNFTISNIRAGTYTLRISYMGYATIKQLLKLHTDTNINIGMEPSAILGEEVNVTATRAQEKYPVAFTDISSKQIQAVNMGKDMPYLIQNTPSTVVTSDAGTGIGYTGINIRGTDLTRINVTINGIPQNDPESQGVWFVDLPDIASSSDNIQIQRGVGTSTNGAGAFGASINIQTTKLNPDPYG
jgi:iron complex outermembrane receptor protein